ncbi:MAG: glycosyltransferase [Desulfocapsa sp.]|nr:MAG: glycosyltransferase [Desulfocapsa sp.]
MDLSLVVPIYNEEENIPLLYAEIKEVLETTSYSYELICVDDGSSDHSVAVLEQLSREDNRVVVIELRRNFGQTAAMSAGFDHARGDIIITMDGDLQNDPHDIPAMVEKLNDGYDVVTGWRHDRKDPFISRKLPSMMANKLISWITGVGLHDYGCTLKAFKHEVTENIRLYGEMHRFIPAIASGMGISFTEVKVNHRARRFGTSKYGISRTIRVILDLLTVKFILSYATRPLHVFGTVGVVSSFIGFATIFFMLIQRQFFGVPMGDRPLLMLAVLMIFMGIQFVTSGLLAELVVRTYHESQHKPIYYVRRIIGGTEKDTK